MSMIDSTYFVQVEYLNVTNSNISYPYTLNGCPADRCPFNTFTSIYQARFPASAEVECAKKDPMPPMRKKRAKTSRGDRLDTHDFFIFSWRRQRTPDFDSGHCNHWSSGGDLCDILVSAPATNSARSTTARYRQKFTKCLTHECDIGQWPTDLTDANLFEHSTKISPPTPVILFFYTPLWCSNLFNHDFPRTLHDSCRSILGDDHLDVSSTATCRSPLHWIPMTRVFVRD